MKYGLVHLSTPWKQSSSVACLHVAESGLFSGDLVVAANVSPLNLCSGFFLVNTECIEIIFKISITTHHFAAVLRIPFDFQIMLVYVDNFSCILLFCGLSHNLLYFQA